MFKIGLHYLGSQKWKLMIYMLISLLSGTVSMLSPVVGARIIDGLIAHEAMNVFIRYCLILVAISILSIFLGYWGNLLYLKMQIKAAFDLNKDVLEHIKKLPSSFMSGKDAAYLNQRINSDSNIVITFVIGAIVNTIINILLAIVACFIIFKFNYIIACTLLGFILIYIFIYQKLKKPIYNRGMEQAEAQNRYFSVLNDQLENVKFIKTHSINDYFMNRLSQFFNNVVNKAVSFQKISYIFHGLDSFTAVLAQISIYLLGGYYVLNNVISVGVFTILNSYFKSLLGSVRYFFGLSKQYQETSISYNRILSLLSEKEQPNGSEKIDSISSITMEDISFGYEDKSILNDLTLNFVSGEIYCVTGDNGSGKSTLIDVLLGMHVSEHEGRIYYDDHLMADIDYEYIRRHTIGFAEQNPVMLKDTIKKNIDIFHSDDHDQNEQIDYDELVKEYGLLNYIRNLPEGMQTIVFEGASNLSGGEKQKISILRVAVQNPSVVIFDEPTNSMDSESVDLFVKNITQLKQDKIVILVSHDERIIRIADQIIHLNSYGRPELLSQGRDERDVIA